MPNNINETTKLELISKARKLVQAKYDNQRNNEYKLWQSTHMNAWKGTHIIVPFPPFVLNTSATPLKLSSITPPEEEVIAEALELYNQLVAPDSVTMSNEVEVLEPEIVNEPAVETVVVEEEIIPVDSVVEPEVLHAAPSEPVVIEPDIAASIVELQPVEVVVETELPKEEVTPVVAITTSNENISNPGAPTMIDSTYVSEIRKIYQQVDAVPPTPKDDPTVESETTPITVPKAIKTVASAPAYEPSDPKLAALVRETPKLPQPSEELAKVSTPGRILPAVLQKLQNVTSMWASTK